MENNDYAQVARWKTVISDYLAEYGKIDDKFIEEFFSKKAQAQFLSGSCDELHDAMIMNGLSGIDCSTLDFSRLSLNNFTKIAFDSDTMFPETVANIFSQILEKGKTFGYGLDELLQSGKLSGEGIHLAVIDESFNISSVDLDDIHIVDYQAASSGDHYHGKTVTSLIASKSCGVARGANVHFFEKDGEIFQEEKKYYKELLPQEEYGKWKIKRGNEFLANNFRKIIEYNQNCQSDSDKITVLSGSWRINPPEEFEKWQAALRSSGCEIVCQNNFLDTFSEISGQDVILDLSDEEKSALSEPMRKNIESLDVENTVKIPINRTYHQFGTNGFKYQASYSNSWGIPQAAGLFALFKAKDKSLTFERFSELCRETASERGIINPTAIYQTMEKAKDQTSIDIDR